MNRKPKTKPATLHKPPRDAALYALRDLLEVNERSLAHYTEKLDKDRAHLAKVKGGEFDDRFKATRKNPHAATKRDVLGWTQQRIEETENTLAHLHERRRALTFALDACAALPDLLALATGCSTEYAELTERDRLAHLDTKINALLSPEVRS